MSDRAQGDRPRVGPTFFKGHGLGNDYLVFQEADGFPLRASSARRICDPHRGVGSDGIVVRLAPRPGGPERLRMFNPDGGEFERSGNGLRVFAAFLAVRGEAPSGPFPVEVGGDTVTLEVLGSTGRGTWDVLVEMGRPSFEPSAVGVDRERESRGPLTLDGPDGEPLDLMTVSVGNPHCVVWVDRPDLELLTRLGPHLSTHPAFAEGINVQLAAPPRGPSIRLLVWERGVGRTAASGTSACAVAAAAVQSGRVEPGEVDLVMEGGSLFVTVAHDWEMTLRGPVEEVCRGELTPGFVQGLPRTG